MPYEEDKLQGLEDEDAGRRGAGRRERVDGGGQGRTRR